MATPTKHSPLHTNYFELIISRIPNMVYFCQEVNLPGIVHSTIDQGTSLGLPVKIPGGAFAFEPFLATFKVDEQMKNWLEIFNWSKTLGNYNQTGQQLPHHEKFSDAKLLITNSYYRPKFAVNFLGIFPTALTGIKFSTIQPDSVEAVCTVTFSFTNYLIETLENP
jgi:hypothetical protein